MNWDAVSAIAEMVGAVAVVTTLAYLALQVRQSTAVNASSIRQGFYDYTTRQMLHGTDSTEFSALLAKAGTTDEELSAGERIQMLRFLQSVFVGYQGAYFQYRHKILNQDDWDMCRALLRSFWLLPGAEIARQWQQLKAGGFLDDEFVAEVEKLKGEAERYITGLAEEGLQFGPGN